MTIHRIPDHRIRNNFERIRKVSEDDWRFFRSPGKAFHGDTTDQIWLNRWSGEEFPNGALRKCALGFRRKDLWAGVAFVCRFLFSTDGTDTNNVDLGIEVTAIAEAGNINTGYSTLHNSTPSFTPSGTAYDTYLLEANSTSDILASYETLNVRVARNIDSNVDAVLMIKFELEILPLELR